MQKQIEFSLIIEWECSSAGRATVSKTVGRGFDPLHSRHFFMIEAIQQILDRWTIDLQSAKDSQQKKIIQEKQRELSKITNIQNQIDEYIVQIKENTMEPELIEVFNAEIQVLQQKMNENFQSFKANLLSHNESIILEIRSGEGGQEAELFALELLEMYKKLCKKMNWIIKLFEVNYKESGGIKDCTAEILGKGVATWIKQESGVHCVKRVPKTEKKGRIHTSTATVAILKQPNEIEVILNDKDLRIDVFRSSGPGGQSVNTTDSAVRITHIPTGITVSQQDEKSQIKNKEKALKILKARIYEHELQKENEKNISERREAIGTAKRNERIRTYHFTQNWINDSRIPIKSNSIDKFMAGEDLLLFLEHLLYFSL